MSKEIFINYWSGGEPNPPSPTLDQMPSYVDIAPLAFVGITPDYQLDFGLLTQHFSASQIQAWIKTVQANGTKVLLSILGRRLGSVPPGKQSAFVKSVAKSVAEWGVNGIDFDYEPPQDTTTLIPLIKALRDALPGGSVFTAPVYAAWTSYPRLLKQLADTVDYVTTMDYTPYCGYDATIDNCTQYVSTIGNWSKLVIGISCMNQNNNSFTPLDDVKRLSAYEPPVGGTKGGAMLYTFSYDVKEREKGGTGYPDGTWTEAIHQGLPGRKDEEKTGAAFLVGGRSL